jgi:catechol 2,3-dioxygenase-like lactoylglutathione lyase family enzyme
MDETCGCPPTTTAAAPGRVHHLIVNVTDLARSRRFYGELIPRLGYPGVTEYPGTVGFWGPAGSFWIKQADEALSGEGFHKDRVGLCEVAFAAGSRAAVDEVHRALVAAGATILDAPREYPEYVPGYYAVFFADPDGIKLEVVHVPGGA